MIVRPATEADVPAFYDVSSEAFEDYSIRYGEPVGPRSDPAIAAIRFRHLISTDPGGAWVAEQDGEVIAGGLALLREGVWGLSLLVTRPAHQSTGAGRAVLDACHAYADGARGRIIMASIDPRALRSYARLGLRADPSLTAVGTPQGVAMPEGVRAGDASDIPFTEAVDRHVRGAAHGADIQAMLDAGNDLLISERGYALSPRRRRDPARRRVRRRRGRRVAAGGALAPGEGDRDVAHREPAVGDPHVPGRRPAAEGQRGRGVHRR